MTDNAANFFVNPGTSWKIVGTGDFNGDGISDYMWRNDNGAVTDWLGTATGGFTDNSNNFFINPGTSWHVVGNGDFNGDGRSDILFRNDNGTVTEWLGQANGGFFDNGATFSANPGATWHVVEIGDFNGDAVDDILWRNNNGTVTSWLGHSNGGMTDNATNLNVNPGTSWHVQDPFVLDPLPFS